jgi:CRP-like cAMP-binding protein
MSRIGYRNPRFYQARQTIPRLDSPQACPPPQAAAPRTDESNEQSTLPATPATPGSANRRGGPSSNIDGFRQCLEATLTSAEDIARQMGVTKGPVSKLAKRAIDEGWLRKNGRKYALT